MRFIEIFGWIVGSIAVVLFLLTLWGLYLKNKGRTPFAAEALAADGGRYVKSYDDRKIECFTYGSEDPDAPVVINMHGSGPEAVSEK